MSDQPELPFHGKDMRLCTGPRHPEGKWLPMGSFAPRSKWCRGCMSDYDKRRGSLRGPPRGLKTQTT